MVKSILHVHLNILRAMTDNDRGVKHGLTVGMVASRFISKLVDVNVKEELSEITVSFK